VTVLLQPACQALHLAGKTVGFVAPAVKNVVSTISDTVMSGMTDFVVNGAVWFVTRIGDAVNSSTSVDVASGWFGSRYRAMAGVAAAFTLLFLLLSCAATLLHRDPMRLGRSVAMVAAAGLGTFAATTIVQLLVVASDQISALVASNIAGDLHRTLTGAAHGLTDLTIATGGNGAPPLFAALIAGFISAIAALVIWIELLLREVAIYATLLFFPLALAGLVWSASAHWARRLAEMLAALIFAKFVTVAILSLAAGGLASGSEGYAGVLGGAALLVVAAFAPWMLMRLISALEVATAAQSLDGSRQRGTRPFMSGGQSAMLMVQRQASFSRGRGVLAVAPAGAAVAAATVAAGAASRAGKHTAKTASSTLPPSGGENDRRVG
jgi:hypothetical protein